MGEVNLNELFYKGKDALVKMDMEKAIHYFSESWITQKNKKSIDYLLYTYLLGSDYRSISNIIQKNNSLTGFSLYTLYWFKLMTGELDELNDILVKMMDDNNYFLRVFAIKELKKKGKIDNLQDTIQQKIKYFGLLYELHIEEQRAAIFLDYLFGRNHLALLQSKTLLKEYPKNGDVYLDFMELVFNTGNISSIKEIVNNETINKHALIDIRIRYLLSRELYCLKEFDKAKEHLLKLVSYFKNNPIFHYNLGNIYLINNNFIKAIEEYEEAILLAPIFERAYYNLGIVYYKLRDINKAIKNFHQAMEISKKPDAIYNLSVCYIEKKELKDAFYYLTKIPIGYSAKLQPSLIKNQIKELMIFT